MGDLGEEKGGARKVLELYELGEEVVGVIEGVDEQLGVDLFEGGEGLALFQEGEDVGVGVWARLVLEFGELWF